MTIISRRMPHVSVEYDARGARRVRDFDDAYAARRFYVAKFNKGKNPHIVNRKER